MIRLVVSGVDDLGAIESRLRGVALAPCATDMSPADAGALAIVDTPAETDLVERWLEAGRCVLCAAMPLPEREQAQEWANLAQRHDARLMLANPERYLPAHQLIREQVPSRLGASGLIRIQRWQAGDAACPLASALDLALWLADAAPQVVHALQGPDGQCIQAHLGFASGAMALVDCVCGLPPGESYRSLSVIGFSGAAYLDDQQNAQLLYAGGRPQALRVGEGVRATTALLHAFVEGLGRAELAGPGPWEQYYAVIAGLRQSLAAGQAVSLGGR